MAVHVQDLGRSATSSGWRKKVADVLAPRAPFQEDRVRAAIGLLFLLSSVQYVAKTLHGATQR